VAWTEFDDWLRTAVSRFDLKRTRAYLSRAVHFRDQIRSTARSGLIWKRADGDDDASSVMAPEDPAMNLFNRKRESSVTVQANGRTITISGEALNALLDAVEREKLTLPEVLARAIALEKAVTDARAEGRKVFIEPKGDRPRELVGA
jgi:hypothetical protein